MAEGKTLSPDPLGEAVHVWVVNLRGSDRHLARCASMVSEPESERAARFRFQRLRRGFLLAHGCARVLLAHYLRVPPSKIAFAHGAYGKPHVISPQTDLCFNQSDSADLAAFAFASGCQLGIDIEAVRPVAEMQDVAARFFSREEAVDLFSLPLTDRNTAFYAAWTRKEAYIKAVGDGLQIPLDAFRVSLRPREEARLIHIGDDERAARDWRMHAFDPAPGFLGALAYRGRRRKVEVFPTMDAAQLLDETVGETANGDAALRRAAGETRVPPHKAKA